MRAPEPDERRAVVLGDEDAAGVADPRHDDRRDAGDGLLVADGRREQLARLGEQLDPAARGLRFLLSALALRDVGHDRADADALARRVRDGVVRGQPRTRDARHRRRLAGDLDSDQGLARLEDPLPERLEHGCERGQDVAHRPAEMLLARDPVELGERVVDPQVAEVAVPEPEADRRRRDERVERGGGLVRLAVEARVLDGEHRPARELLRQREVALVEAPARLGGEHRDGADRAPAEVERHAHPGADPELLQLRGDRRRLDDVRCDQSRVGVRIELRLAGAHDGRHADGRVRVERHVAQPGEDVVVAAAGVLDGEPLDRAVVGADVDHAPVAEPRDREPRHLGERALVVERR